VDLVKMLHGLYFNDNPVVDPKIEPDSRLQFQTFVRHRNENLALNSKPSTQQLIAERRLVDRLQQPRAKYSVNLDCRAYDLVRERIVFNLCVLCALRGSVVNHQGTLG